MTDAQGLDPSGPEPARRIPLQSGAPTQCHTCGSASPGANARVIGVWSLVDGSPVWDCARCAREHLVNIESGRSRERW